MNIVFEGDYPRLKEMLQSEFFSELLFVFQENPQPTLREIKAQVTDTKVDRKIDFLVQEQVIQRKDRRYSLLFSVTEDAEENLDYQKVKQQFLSLLQGKTQEERMLFILALYPEESISVPFILEEQMSFSYCEKISNDLLEIVSVSTQKNAFCLPHYFNRQLTLAERQVYSEVETILGDVDADYYLDQIWAILEKVHSDRRRIRESIFLNSLASFKVLRLTDRWTLEVPVYSFCEKETLAPLQEEVSAYAGLSLIEQRRILSELMTRFDLSDFTIVFMNKERS